MKHIREFLLEAIDVILEQQPCEEAHCVQNQRDLYDAADDVADWAQTHPVVVGVTA